MNTEVRQKSGETSGNGTLSKVLVAVTFAVGVANLGTFVFAWGTGWERLNGHDKAIVELRGDMRHVQETSTSGAQIRFGRIEEILKTLAETDKQLSDRVRGVELTVAQFNLLNAKFDMIQEMLKQIERSLNEKDQARPQSSYPQALPPISGSRSP